MMTSAGTVVWVLVVLALVALAIFLERFFELRRSQIDAQDFVKGIANLIERGNVDEALSVCEDTAVPVAAVVTTAIRHASDTARLLREAVDAQGRAEIGRLDRRLASLAILAQVAPLAGLLGSVLGFVSVVRAASSEAVVSRAALFGSAVEALVAAAAGIALAILASVLYGILRTRLERIVVDLEAAASQIVGFLATREVSR